MCVWLTESLDFMLQNEVLKLVFDPENTCYFQSPHRKLSSLQFSHAAPQFSVISAPKMSTQECLYLSGDCDSVLSAARYSSTQPFICQVILLLGEVSRKAPLEKPKMY